MHHIAFTPAPSQQTGLAILIGQDHRSLVLAGQLRRSSRSEGVRFIIATLSTDCREMPEAYAQLFGDPHSIGAAGAAVAAFLMPNAPRHCIPSPAMAHPYE